MTREEFIREIIVSLTKKRNLITDIIFDAQTIIKMADDFVAHREFKLNDDVELVAEKRYNEREDIKPSKNVKRYNYTVVWDDKTDESKVKEEEKFTSLSDNDAIKKFVQKTKEPMNCEIDDDIERDCKYGDPDYGVPECEIDNEPESEFEIECQEGD